MIQNVIPASASPLSDCATLISVVYIPRIAVWPLWPVILAMNFQRIGPTHSAKKLRVSKHHLDTGGIVYVVRPPAEIAAIAIRGKNERTTEDGALLNVSTHMSLDQANPLDREIDLFGACFVGRTAIPHESIHAVRYYAFVRSHGGVSSHSSLIAQLISQMSASVSWLRSVLTHTMFTFPQ